MKKEKNGRKNLFVIAHNIRSLYNLGSIFRTAEAFGVSKIYLTGYTGTPHNPIHLKKIAKTALGAEKYVAWEYAKTPQQVIRNLKKQKFQIIGLENNISKTTLLTKFTPKFPLALLLGEEVKGISKTLISYCDELVEIPMLGKKESLNVSVAFGIAGYEISKNL